VSALKVCSPVLVTRKGPADELTSAALPTFASGDAASMFNVSMPFAIVPVRTDIDGAFEPEFELGEVGLPPPQLSRSAEIVTKLAA
jgi:hypothetical protein